MVSFLTCSKSTGEHSWQSVISIKLQSNFIEITLQYGCSPVNLLHIFRTPFLKNTSGGLLLYFETFVRFFSDGKNKPMKRTKFISPIKNLRANVLFNVLSILQINEFSFFYDSIVKKAIQKNFYIALTNTCLNKDIFIMWTNSWMHLFKLVISSILCVDTRRLI